MIEIDRREVDPDQLARRIAHEPLGERRLDRLRHNDVRDGPVDPLVHIIGTKAKIGIRQRLPIAAELEHRPAVRLQVRIAAGDRRHQHRLPGREIENPSPGSLQQRIAELVDCRRTFLAAPAGDEVEAIYG